MEITSFKRSVVHGFSPNPKKDFTKLRRRNSDDGFCFNQKPCDEKKRTAFSLDDSFDFTELDLVDNVLPDDDSVSKTFLFNLKSFDLTIEKVIRRCDEVVILTKKIDKAHSRTDEIRLILRGFWMQTQFVENDKIRVFVPKDVQSENTFILDNDESFILTKPDTLLTSTSISTAVFCRRKTILNEKFQCGDPCNKATLVGTLVHELFQKAVADNISNIESLTVMAKNMVSDIKIMEQMYFLDLTDDNLWEELNVYIPQVSYLISKKFQKNSMIFDENPNPKFFFNKIHDIEENIWMPKYGIRGKIDLTLDLYDQKAKRHMIPLELKTGRTTGSAEHKGQVSLYTSMLTELYPNTSKFGALLYLKEAKIQCIELKRKEFHGIVQLRNFLSYFMNEFGSNGNEFQLPETINSVKFCSNCPQLLNCSIFQKLEENFTENKENNEDSWSKLVSTTLDHLKSEDFHYFKRWLRWICIETAEKSSRKRLTDIWTVTASEREDKKEALCDLQVDHVTNDREIILFRAEFSSRTDFPAGVFDVGQYAVLSNETSSHVATAMGSVGFADEKMIKLIVDQKLIYNHGDVFRLDHYGSFATSLRISLGNLTKLLNKNQSKLRNLIVDGREPAFRPEHHSDSNWIENCRKKLKCRQILAFSKILRAEDYVLIKFFNGSDKALTIAYLIDALLVSGVNSVLLASSTHSALDNILSELEKFYTNVVRLGSDAQAGKSFSITNRMQVDHTLGRMKEIYDNSKVVAATCSSIGTHPIFVKRHFDLVIVDESTMLTEISCIAPLLCAQKFILVSDQQEGYSFIASNVCKSEGMGQSLFSRLEREHPNAVVNFN